MAHKPVVEQRYLAPLTFGGADIPAGRVGLLYDGPRFWRKLQPGDSLTFGERLKSLTLYVVDVQPHTAVWNINLQTREEEDMFPVSIRFEYRVDDAQRMVDRQTPDTEALLSRALERALRAEARRFPLNRYREVESALEDVVRQEIAAQDTGLELIQVDVTINLDTSTRERLRQLEDLERAMRVPQLCEHTAHLPSKEPTVGFDTRVAVTYRVSARDRLPTRTLQEAEEWLWRQVQRVLRRTSRGYTVEQVAEAEEGMQLAIEDERFSDHGLEVVSALVEIDLDPVALQRAKDLVEVRARREFEEAQATLQDWQRRRQINQQVEAVQFYRPLIEGGQWTLLAMILSQDPTSAEKILAYLEGQRKETLATQIGFFKDMVSEGALAGFQMEQWARALGDRVVDQAMRPQLGTILPQGGLLQQLVESKEEETRPAEATEKEPEVADKEQVVTPGAPTEEAHEVIPEAPAEEEQS